MADIEKDILIRAKTDTAGAEQDLNSLKGGLKEVEQAADKASGGLLSSFKKMAKNPYIAGIVAAITLIRGAFNRLKEAISKNDTAGTSFQRLFAIVKAPAKKIEQWLDRAAVVLGKIADAIGTVYKTLMPKKWREEAEAEEELVLATDKLEDTERQYAEKHAKRESDISELERKARDSENLTAVERKKALNEIYRLRKEDYDDEKRIIEERIRLWYIQNRNISDASDEQKNILSQLQVALTNVNTKYNDALRATDRLSRSVNEKIIADWVEIAKKHGDAKKAIAEYHEEVLRGELQSYYTDLSNTAEDFYKAFFGEDGKLWKNYSFDARQNILSMYNAIKSGDESIIPRVKASYVDLWKKYHLYTEEEIKNADARTQANFAQMQTYEKILSIFERISTTTERVNQERIESEKAVSDALTTSDTKTNDTIIQNAERTEAKRHEIRQLEIDAMEDSLEKRQSIEEEAYNHSLATLKLRLMKGEITQEEYDKISELQEKKHRRNLSAIEEKWNKEQSDAKEKDEKDKENKTKETQRKNLQQARDYYKEAAREARNSADEINDELNKALKANDFEGARDAIDKLKTTLNQSISRMTDEMSNVQNDIASNLIGGEEGARLIAEYQEKIDELQKKLRELDETSTEINAAQSEHGWNNWINSINKVADALGALGGVFDAMASGYQQALDRMFEENETFTESQREQAYELAESQYHATMAGIILNQATALGNAIAGAIGAFRDTSGGVVARIAAMTASLAAGTAAIISGISQAKQATATFEEQKEKIKKYATGGYVEGAGTTTSDSIPARLSNGEAVINARSTSMFYDLLSRINQAGGGVAFPNAQNSPILHFARGGVANNTQTMIEAVKTAVKGVQPVVSVKEITKVQNKLKLKEI